MILKKDKEYVKLIVERVLGIFMVTIILLVIIAGINIYQDEGKKKPDENKDQPITKNEGQEQNKIQENSVKETENKDKSKNKESRISNKTQKNSTDFNVTAKPFEKRDEIVYTTDDGINVRNRKGEKVKQLLKGAKITRVGYNEEWSEVMLGDKKYYISSQYLTN